MTTAFVVAGRITEDGKLELEEHVPVKPGPVRVSIETVTVAPSEAASTAFAWPDAEELRVRKARLLELAGSISDEEAQEMIRMRVVEFDQVDLDEWR
jgi:hypothetical protein